MCFYLEWKLWTCQLIHEQSISTDLPLFTNLDLRADLNGFFEATEGAECSNCLPANGLKLSQFPATAAPILQDTLSVLAQLRNEHQRPGEHLPQTPSEKAFGLREIAYIYTYISAIFNSFSFSID